jgi:ASC-1-like (ASCH) protein/predicted nucleic acid-binding protein
MKRVVMKIREKFLPYIRNGQKKREYRLATPDRLTIRPGDILVLVSNQDSNNYANALVTSVHRYPDWEEPLSLHWKEDFSQLFSSQDEALHELKKFYTAEQVKEFGVVVFDIQPADRKTLEKQRVLLDTNEIIRRESYSEVTFEVANLYKWLDKLNCTKLIHPDTIKEIEKYKDQKIKDAILTKLTSYTTLATFADEDPDFHKAMEKYKQDENGLVDNKLLYAVYSSSADILITDDRLLLEKAHDLYLDDRVMSVDQFLKAAEDEFPKLVDYNMLSVKLKTFGSLNLGDPFFDSLKEDYPDFEKWFHKKNEQKAYVFESKNEIHGFLYVKLETPNDSYEDIEPTFEPKRRLKVGTFKIDESLKGFRLGERFLKIIFDNAVASKVDEIYVTLFENHRNQIDRLAELLKDWGFVYWGTKSGKESVLVKKMNVYDPEKSPKFNFPNHPINSHAYFLPIMPQYHTNLFPDAILKNEDMSLYSEEKGHLYSLEKIYVTDAYDIQAKPGDLLVIYRMGERYPKAYSSVCTSLAIFEESVIPNNVEEYLNTCKNKSIFEESELRRFYERGKYKTVIKMIFLRNFERKITLEELREKRLVDSQSGPRPFSRIPDGYISYFSEHK